MKKGMMLGGGGIFSIGLIKGIFDAGAMVQNSLSADLTLAWNTYIYNFAVSFIIMAFGGAIFLAGYLHD